MKVKELLLKLTLIDSNTPEFVEVSKQLVDAVRDENKKKLEKKAKKPDTELAAGAVPDGEVKKEKKAKKSKTELCGNCYELLNSKLADIVPKKV